MLSIFLIIIIIFLLFVIYQDNKSLNIIEDDINPYNTEIYYLNTPYYYVNPYWYYYYWFPYYFGYYGSGGGNYYRRRRDSDRDSRRLRKINRKPTNKQSKIITLQNGLSGSSSPQVKSSPSKKYRNTKYRRDRTSRSNLTVLPYRNTNSKILKR